MTGRVSSFIVAAAVTVLAGCGGGGGSSSTSATTAQGQPAPAGGKPTLEKIGDFDQPTYVAQPPGSNDLYVVEQGGSVRIVRDGQVLSEPALDITDQVTNNGEQGLLSIAFPPDFQSSHLVYAYFTGTDQNQHVVRYTVRSDGSFDEGSAREILNMADFASNHNGGQLQFGPDGDLYIGTGDGGPGGRSAPHGPEPRHAARQAAAHQTVQRKRRPALHDPAGQPVRQPAPGGPAGDLLLRAAKSLALQLRRQDRRDLDRRRRPGHPRGGGLQAEGPGQGARTSAGRPSREPTASTSDQTAPNAVPPIFDYSHDGDACSITGGYVVRDRSLPVALRPLRLRGLLHRRSAQLRAGDPARQGRPLARSQRPLGLARSARTTQDHIYVTSLDGPVYRLVAGG